MSDTQVGTSVLQSWVERLPLMQQSVLLTAVRGPDGLPKYHPSKYLLRWYRRSILISAFDGHALTNPCTPGGGSFTGPSVVKVLDAYVAEGGLRDRTTHVPAEPEHMLDDRLSDHRDRWLAHGDEGTND